MGALGLILPTFSQSNFSEEAVSLGHSVAPEETADTAVSLLLNSLQFGEIKQSIVLENYMSVTKKNYSG